MGISLSLAEFSIALGTATVIAVGVILTVTKMLIGQVLRSIKESDARQEKVWKESEARQEKAREESEARQEKAREESEARQEKAWKESKARQEKAWIESETRQEKSQTENETRYFDDLQEIKSVMKQMNGRIDDLAHAMYDINGQLQRIVGYLGMEEIIVEKKPRTRRRSEMPWSPAPPLSTP